MNPDVPAPDMRISNEKTSIPRVKSGMSVKQVREIWRACSEAKTKESMDKYTKQKAGRSGGREGFDIYGQSQSRA